MSSIKKPIELKKCFGIPSYIPSNQPDRDQRIERLERLFKQLNELFPSIPILIIAQNWGDYKVPDYIKDKVIIEYYEPLGILKARKQLRESFLKLDFDYIIMADDDMIIQCDKGVPEKYLKALDNHPNGFCVTNYEGAQLNLCAVSRSIYEAVPMVDYDPQKSEGFEDKIYTCLLHYTLGDKEFTVPGIKHIQFLNKDEPVPSTWAYVEPHDWSLMNRNTDKVCNYIIKYHQLPNKKDIIKYNFRDESLYDVLDFAIWGID